MSTDQRTTISPAIPAIDRLLWRYRREAQVLYVSVIHRGRTDYSLTWRYPDGTSSTLQMSNVARLYDFLAELEADFGAEGWELLPVDQRAPNRLPTPTCDLCAPGAPVITTTRTETHVHFRCGGCARIWIVAKPGIEG